VKQFLLGVTLGLGAGVAPGPLLALVIRASLEGGFAAGARVACAPLVTDLPIVLFAVLLASRLPEAALGALGIAGGLFVAYLGVEALRDVPAPAEEVVGAPVAGSVRRGALVNLLNPHPWVFWITVGAPILGDAGVAGAIAFLIPFYVLLVGGKVVLAAGLGAGRERVVHGRGYAAALRAAGALMLVAGVLLIVEGVRSL
jgi:threonine/homoserine/homoserine lactone efflux protein